MKIIVVKEFKGHVHIVHPVQIQLQWHCFFVKSTITSSRGRQAYCVARVSGHEIGEFQVRVAWIESFVTSFILRVNLDTRKLLCSVFEIFVYCCETILPVYRLLVPRCIVDFTLDYWFSGLECGYSNSKVTGLLLYLAWALSYWSAIRS